MNLLMLSLLVLGCDPPYLDECRAGDDCDGDGFSEAQGDCDESDPAVNPGADEACDGIDNDCDAYTDEDGAIGSSLWILDYDGDGYGDPALSSFSCTQPAGMVALAANSVDCDDHDPDVYPGAPEVCDGKDNDCDAVVDADAEAATDWYTDADGDGYGDPDQVEAACTQPTGAVEAEQATDCDDTLSSVHPGAAEVWNGVDDDCDGVVDRVTASGVAAWTLLGPDADYHLGEQGRMDIAGDLVPGTGAAELVVVSSFSAPQEYGTAWIVGHQDDASPGSIDGAHIGSITNQSVCHTFDATTGLSEDVTQDTAGLVDLTIMSVSNGCPTLGNLAWTFAGEDAAFEGDQTHTTYAWSFGDDQGDDDLSSVVAADIDADGHADLALGYRAWGDAELSEAGVVVLHLSPIFDSLEVDADESQGELYLTGNDDGDHLGSSLSAADLDGDGCSELVVGADGWGGRTAIAVVSLCDSGVYTLGAVSAWVQVEDWARSIFTAPASWDLGQPLDRVTPSDVDGDGLPDLIIQAAAPGAVFLFASGGEHRGEVELDMLTGEEPGTLVITGPSLTRFGEAVAATSDLDGDGYHEIAVGAPGTHVTLADGTVLARAGAVYLFDLQVGWSRGVLDVSDAEAVFYGSTAEEELGSGLASGGDLDGDGRDDLVIGARNWDSTGCGAVLGVLGWGP